MDWADYSYLVWIVSGILFMVVEFIIPGVFIVFVGIGAIFTGFLTLFFNFGFYLQIFVWILSSFSTVIIGAPFLKKIFPSQSMYVPLKEDDSIGKIVKVVKDVNQTKNQGRIKYQGTEWNAVCKNGGIPASTYAKILARNNLTFLIEKATETEVERYLNSLEKNEESINFDSI